MSENDNKTKENVIGQLSKSITILALLVVVLIVIIVVIVSINKPKEKVTTIDTSETIELSEEVINGRKLFRANCSSCHTINRKLLGPPLAGLTERRDLEWIYAYVKNNKALRESGDEIAIQIYEEYKGLVMTPFPNLSNEDIDDILAYIESKEN